jgi:hypothetical protein
MTEQRLIPRYKWLEIKDARLFDDLRNVWALVSDEPGISQRGIARRLGFRYGYGRKLVMILLESGNLINQPGTVGTLRATVPLLTMKGNPDDDKV